MKVWEAINILESLDPNAEVTLVLGKNTKPKDNSYDKTYVIVKEQWPRYNPDLEPFYKFNHITCTDKVH